MLSLSFHPGSVFVCDCSCNPNDNFTLLSTDMADVPREELSRYFDADCRSPLLSVQSLDRKYTTKSSEPRSVPVFGVLPPPPSGTSSAAFYAGGAVWALDWCPCGMEPGTGRVTNDFKCLTPKRSLAFLAKLPGHSALSYNNSGHPIASRL